MSEYGGFLMALHYCKKCGRVVEIKTDKTGYKDDTCDYCKSKVYPVPEKYWLDVLDFLITNEQKELLREEFVKTSPEFDEYLFEHRDEILAKKSAEFDAKMEHGKAILAGLPKCPTCSSTNIQKIGIGERAASVYMLGIFSRKINKSFKCKNCGYTW